MNGNFGVASNHSSGVEQPFKEPVIIYERVLFEKTNPNSSTRFVARVVHFAGSNTPYVVIARHWFKADLNQWVPTKANIFLPVSVWRALVTDRQLEEIDETLKNGLWIDEQLAGSGSGAAGANVPATNAGTSTGYQRGINFFTGAGAASRRITNPQCSQTTATGYSPFKVPRTALNGSDDGESDEPKRGKHDE